MVARLSSRSSFADGSLTADKEKPVAITWEFDVPLPGDLYAAFAAAVA